MPVSQSTIIAVRWVPRLAAGSLTTGSYAMPDLLAGAARTSDPPQNLFQARTG